MEVFNSENMYLAKFSSITNNGEKMAEYSSTARIVSLSVSRKKTISIPVS